MAMKAPTTAIHQGSVAGRLKARSIPVTTAEKSLMATSRPTSLQYRYSKITQAATVTAVRIRELIPKMMTEAISVGTRAMQTRCMIFWVLSTLVIWGAAVTINLLSITSYLHSSS